MSEELVLVLVLVESEGLVFVELVLVLALSRCCVRDFKQKWWTYGNSGCGVSVRGIVGSVVASVLTSRLSLSTADVVGIVVVVESVRLLLSSLGVFWASSSASP